MSAPSKETLELYNELKWVTIEENNKTFTERLQSKGLAGIFVPLGVVITAGILFRGVHYMFKKDSVKQQQFMRYRVVAQGITICLATAGLLSAKP